MMYENANVDPTDILPSLLLVGFGIRIAFSYIFLAGLWS
jgi:hypothetical protein